MKRHVGPVLAVVAAVAVALWPLPLGSRALGHPLSDLADHYQGAWWWGGQILAGRLPLHSDITQVPVGTDLWYVDPVGAALALLFRPLGFPAAWNLALYVSILAASLAAYGMATRRFGSRGAGLVAAVAVGPSPFVLGLVHSGLSEYLGLLFPVLFLALLLDALDGRRNPLWAGLALAGCTLQAFYFGAFAVLLALALLVGEDVVRRLKVVGLAVGTGLVLSSPLLWLALRSMETGVVGEESAPGWKQPVLPATDLSLFLRPGNHYFPDTPALGNPGILHVHYLGWILVGLAVWGFWRHPELRRHRWAWVAWMVASLGPAAAWMGHPVSDLPLAFLYRIPHSPWSYVHHPYRLAAFTLPFLAVGAGAAVAGWRRLAPLAALGILLETLLLSSAPWPLATTDMAPPEVMDRIPGPGGVLDWPPDGTTANRSYTAWQVEHGRPIPYGLNTFLPDPLLGDPLVSDLLLALDDLGARTRNRDVPREVRVRKVPPGPSHLAGWGLRWIVLHRDRLSEGEARRTESLLEERLGEPVIREGSVAVWDAGSERDPGLGHQP